MIENNPLPIQSLWIGERLSKVEQLSIKSFLDNGHEYHLYVYNSIDHIPKGTTILDANKIISGDKIFQLKNGWGKGSYSAFADLFRFKLLLEKGGWWFDTDIICLKPLQVQEKDLIIATSFEDQWGICANNCVLKASAGHPLLEKLYEEANSADVNEIKFGQTGVHLLQTIVKEMKLEEYFSLYTYFNPISWRDVGYYILGKKTLKEYMKESVRPYIKPSTMEGKAITDDSYCVHFWNEVWRQNGWDKNGIYAKDSLFEKLKKKHSII